MPPPPDNPEGEPPECEVCSGEGHLQFAGCPRQIVDSGTWQLLKLVKWMDQGMPPVAGGSLDQTFTFMRAADFVRAEEKKHEAKSDPLGLRKLADT